MYWRKLADKYIKLGPTWDDIFDITADESGEIYVKTLGTGRIIGGPSNIIDYSYSEGSTPLIPGDESGAVGEVTIDVADRSESSIVLYGDEYYLRDRARGSVAGSIENVSLSNNTLSMGGRSRLAKLNTTHLIPTMTGTISEILGEIFAVVGLTERIIYDATLPAINISTPGYEGDLWTFVKQIASAYYFEVTVIDDYIVVRNSREVTVDASNITEHNLDIESVETARYFDVAYYDYQPETDFLVYPKGGWTPELQVYQVNAEETVEIEVDLEFYLTSVKQPIALDTVPKDYGGSASVYSISGNDNLPIPAALWNDFGGEMSFEILGTGNRLKITITGPALPEYSPYTIGVSDGSTSYSTLRIVGSGTNYERKLYRQKTGLNMADTAIEVGNEIDNPVLDSLEDAKRYSLFARRAYCLPTQTFTTTSFEFPISNASIPFQFYPTFGEYNASVSTFYTFADFNSDYATFNFSQFGDSVVNTIAQGFGFTSGARAKLGDAFYRIREVTLTPRDVSISAEYDTLFDDLRSVFRGPEWRDMEEDWAALPSTWDEVVGFEGTQKTFEDFNEIFDDLTFSDYALIPLRDKAI